MLNLDKYSKAKNRANKGKDIAIPYYGYKNHISIDCRYKFIRNFIITAANAYDGHYLEALLDSKNSNKEVFGDKAYGSQKNIEYLHDNGFISMLHAMHDKTKDKRKLQISAAIEYVSLPIWLLYDFLEPLNRLE